MHSRALQYITALAIFGLGGTAMAAGPWVGADYSWLEFESEETRDTLKPRAAIIRGGLEFNRWLGVEARAGTGIRSDKRSVPGGEARFDLDRLIGGYVTLSLPVDGAARPYLIGGFTEARGEATGDFNGVQFSDTETTDDNSWGAGIALNLTDTLAINAEYMEYLDNSDGELSSISLGVRSAF